jgi:hypothetical protein
MLASSSPFSAIKLRVELNISGGMFCIPGLHPGSNALLKISKDFVCNSAVNVIFICHFKNSFIFFF